MHLTGTPSGQQIERCRKRLGLTAQEFADLFGHTRMTLYRWESRDGQMEKSHSISALLIRWLTELPNDRIEKLAKRFRARIRGGTHMLAAFTYAPEALRWLADNPVLSHDVATPYDVEPAVVRSVG
jgi:transcriptional regulator with XRE-family HTH domain